MEQNELLSNYEDVDIDSITSSDLDKEIEDQQEGSLEDELYDELSEEERKLYDNIQKKLMDKDPIRQLFNQLETRPSDEQIEKWKTQHGAAYYIPVGHDHFVLRPLRRLEWRNLIDQVSKTSPQKQDEAFVIRACLYPDLSSLVINQLPAGTIDTLRFVISRISNFYEPQHALELVREL